jgi:hypothetical protein
MTAIGAKSVLFGNPQMLLAAKKFITRPETFAARQMKPADLAANHVFLPARTWRPLCTIASLRTVLDHHIGNHKDGD